MRKEFPAKVKVQAFQRCAGRCEMCNVKLLDGEPRYDHAIPDGLTGEPTLENCQVLCRRCHDWKTKTDVAQIAKAKRRARRSAGIRKPSRFPASRDSRWRKKINGEVVER